MLACILVGCTPIDYSSTDDDTNNAMNQVSDVDEKKQDDKELLSEENQLELEIEEWIASHSVEEKINQMFMITPEQLTGYSNVTAAGETTRARIMEHPVGGIIYFKDNLVDVNQTTEMLSNTIGYYNELGYPVPFLSTDEEGGRVSRIGSNANFDLPNLGDMILIGNTGDDEEAKRVGQTLGTYLSRYGFNMDMAPVADVLTNPNNEVIGDRSFGADPLQVASMATAEGGAMRGQGVLPVYKHFPGHGATTGDSHDGFVSVDKSLEELEEAELVPFQKAIDQGAEVIMVGHIAVPTITGNNEPSSLSHYMISDVLRDQMGFDGIVITDAMNMGAIQNNYNSATMAVKAVNAGVDIILMPEDYETAYNAVVDAVYADEISEQRIDESLRRILRVKLQL